MVEWLAVNFFPVPDGLRKDIISLERVKDTISADAPRIMSLKRTRQFLAQSWVDLKFTQGQPYSIPDLPGKGFESFLEATG